MSKKRDLEIYRAQLQQYYRQSWYVLSQHPKPVKSKSKHTQLGTMQLERNEDCSYPRLLIEIERMRGKVELADILLSFDTECSRDCCDGDGSITINIAGAAEEEDPLWEAKMKIWDEEWELAPTTREKVKTDNEQERVKQLRKELATLEAKLKK